MPQPSALRLRASQAEDVAGLYRVWQSSVAATHDFVSPEDMERIAMLVRDQYLPSADFTVACDADDRIVAFLGMTGNSIDALFVDADARGSGVGRALIEHAQALHADGLVVDVNEQNTQAVGFYEKMGFRVAGRSPVDHEGRPYPLLHLGWRPGE